MESEALSYSWRYLINKPLQEMDEMLLCSCSLQSSGTSELSGKRRIFQRCTCRSDVCEKLLPLVQSCSLYNRNSVKCKPWRRKPLPLYSLQKIYFTTLWFKLLLINCFEGFTRVWSETTMVKMHLSHIFHWYLVFILLGGLSLPLTSGLEDSLYVSSSDRNQLPNQVIYQGSVFSYTIPERAFDCALDTFVVSETADRFLSNWLAYDDVKRLLYGVPSEKDIGTYNILVVALAKGERVRGHICGSKSFSITVMPLDEHLPISVYLGSGSHDESKQESVQSLPCTPGMQAVLGTVILSTDLQELNGHERITVLLKMANHLNIVSNKVRLFSGAVSHPMIQQLDSPALMAAGPGDGRFNKGARSLLTWNVGCGAVRLEDATLARLESDAQDGTITTLLGFPVVGWHVTSGTQKSVVRRRFRRQVGGTPTPTPTMSGALPTQMSSISTSVIMSRSIISTKTVYSSSSTKKLSTSTVDLSSEMSKRTTLGPSRNSSVVSISKSPSVLVSTPVLSSFVPGTISTLAMSNSVLTLNRTTTGLLRSSMEETLVNRTSLIDQSQLATSSATLLLNATTGLVMSSTEEILVNRTSLISQSALAASTVTMSPNATTRLVMSSTEEASVNRTSLISPSVLTLSTVILSPNATTGFVMSSTETTSVNRTSLTYSSTLGSIVTLSPNKTRGIMMTSTETNVNRTSVISPSPLSTSTVSLSLSTTSGFVVSSAEATSVNMRSVISKSSLSPTSPNKTTTTILSTSAGFNLMTTPSSLLDTSVVPSNSSTVFVFKTPSRTLSSPVEFSSVNRTTLATSSLLTMVAPNVTSAMIITSVNSLLIPETHSLLGSSNRTAQVFSSSAVSSVSHHISSLVTTVSSMASPGITRLSPVATSTHSSAVVTNLSTPQTIATILTSRRVPISSYSSTVLGTVLSSFPYHSSSTLGLLSNTSTMISSSPVVSATQLQSNQAHSSILQSSMRTAQNLTASTVRATVVSTMQQSVTMLSSTILQSVSESSQVVITSGELQQSSVMTVSNATVSRNTTLQPSMFSGSTINIRSSVTSSPLTAKSSMLPNSTVVIDKSSLFTIATPAFSPTVTRGARSLSSSAATNQTLVPVTSVEPNESSVIASSTPHLQTTVFTLSTGFPVTPNMTSTFVFTRVFRTASQLTNSTKVVVTTTGSLSLVPNSSFHFVLSSTALPKTTRSSSFFPSSFFTSSVVPVLNSSVVSPQSSLLPGSDFASPTLVVSNSSNAMNGSGTSTVPASGSFTNKPALTTTIILRNTTVVVRSSVFLPSASTIVNFSSSLTITKTNLASRHTRTFSSADVNSSRVVFRDSSTVFETHSAISSISTERARNSTVLFSRLTPSSPLLSSISSIHLRNTTTPFSASQVISNFSSAPRTSSVLVNVTYSVKRTTGISSSTIQPPSSPFQSLTSALNMSAGPSPSSSVPPMMTGSTVALYSSHGTVVPFTSSTLFTVSSGVSVSPSPTVNGSVSSLSSVDVSGTLPSRSASSNISQTVTVTNITKSIAPTSTVAPVVPNSPPQVYNNIGRLTAAAGKAWYYKIPSDTFYDAEDHADTRNLTLSLSFVDGRIIPADFWLQFHNETQIIYGLPMSTHVPRGNNGEQLVLRARDSQGAETHDAFEVLVVELEIPLVQQLTVKFSNDFLAFSSNVSQRLLLLRKIADYYGDSDESVIRVSAFTSGSVIMTWSNDSLPTESCDEEKVNYVENKIFLPSGEIREEFGVALDGFPVESGSHRRLGVCNESNVVPPGTIAPLQRSSSEDGLWHKLVLVGVLVALVIIIIAIFLAWHFRRKRPKPYDREKRTYKKRKPIVLEPEIELKPISGKPIVLPDDDPSIPPSYLSETSLDKPPGNYSDEDEEDYGKRSPSVYNKPPPPTYLEPSESPPPPYILPPIYGSYC